MKLGENKINGGIQIVHKFDNGYGASVAKHSFSYGHKEGLWELAVIKFNDEKNPENYSLCYDTEVTNDVIGHLTKEDVQKHLKEIEVL